jgi:molybdopterin molybdotransferase
MTGAPIPQNSYDAVIKVEDVKVERDSSGNAKKIEVSRSIKAGENIRYQGTDIKKGQLILKSNTKLLPDNIMVCASLGAVSIPVYRKPRVLIVSTGNEIVDASSQELKPGMVRNSTSSYLISILKKFGAQVCYLGIIQDEPKVYKDKLQKALEEKYDVIISTGAVSMGQYDFVPHACEELGAKIYFHKVAIRPGKPILFASWENKSMYQTVFFGLPGNPVSSAVGFQFFVEPYLRIILGLEPLKTFFARLHSDCKKPKGLRSFYKANLKFLDDACLEVEVHSRQESYIVSALSDTNAWAILPEESDYLVKGSLVEVILKSYGNE